MNHHNKLGELAQIEAKLKEIAGVVDKAIEAKAKAGFFNTNTMADTQKNQNLLHEALKVVKDELNSAQEQMLDKSANKEDTTAFKK